MTKETLLLTAPPDKFVGAIYDVDDTLLSNFPMDGNPFSLHERSRLQALHEIGRELGVTALTRVTDEENERDFLGAPQHSAAGAVWQTLHRLGVVGGKFTHEHPVVEAVLARKATLHMTLLLSMGVEVPGASAFVRGMDRWGLRGRQAIASGARHEEIQVFLAKYRLTSSIPRRHIVAWGDYRHPKPHQEPFDQAYRRLGLPDTPEMRARTLVVEDDPKGVESARRNGNYVCALTTRFPADRFLNSPYQRPHAIAPNLAVYGRSLGLSNM